MKTERIDKFLAECGIGTRSEVKQYVKKKKVTVNGNTVNDPGTKVSEADEVCFEGKILSHSLQVYYMLNKPAGVISATEDKNDKTVIDLLKGENIKDLFPVGRLDKDTEGLLIITNDGILAHNLLSPKKHVNKCYYVVSDNRLSPDDINRFSQGIDIGDDKLCKPASVTEISTEEAKAYLQDDLYDAQDAKDANYNTLCYHFLLNITEGRFHQVKRMFLACGCKVVYLKRISVGEVTLDMKLKKGEFRRLSDEEIRCLKQHT